MLGFFRIGDFEPHVDSGLVLRAVATPSLKHLKEYLSLTDCFGGFYPPLYFVFQKINAGIFGSSLTVLTAFSIPFHVLLILSTAKFFDKQKMCEGWAGKWCAAMIALSPVFIWWDQTMKYNMLCCFLTGGFIMSGIQMQRGEDRSSRCVHIVSGTAESRFLERGDNSIKNKNDTA